MTTYGYECRLDGHFERDFKMGSQPSTIECPVCKDEAVRSYSVPAVAFKGKGFTQPTIESKGRNVRVRSNL